MYRCKYHTILMIFYEISNNINCINFEIESIYKLKNININFFLFFKTRFDFFFLKKTHYQDYQVIPRPT